MDQGLIWGFSTGEERRETEGAVKRGAYPLENPNTMCSYLLNVTFTFLLEDTPSVCAVF